MKIAVVIVNFNSGARLSKCVDHLLRQTRPADAIIVMDNASDDDSIAQLTDNEGLHVQLLDQNVGFAAANNLAFAQAGEADYFITLNPDAYAAPDFIETLERAANDQPEYASFASRMMLNSTTVDGAGDNYHVTGLAWRHLHNRPYNPQQHAQVEVFAPCAGAAMYRARDVRDLEGFDESFFCYMEDVDLGYRLRLRGQRSLYVPDAVVEHEASAITGQIPGFAVYHGHRNLVWVMLKNTPTLLLLLVLPAHLLATVVLVPIFLARGQFTVYARAKLDALKAIGKIWRSREGIRKTREISNFALLRSFDFGLRR